MPKLFLTNEPHTRPVAATPLVNPNATAAVNQGLQNLGRGVQSLGDAAGAYAQRLAQHENGAALAYEEAERIRVQGEFEAFVADNPNNPGAWQEAYEQMITSYEKGRSDRASGKAKDHNGWAPVVHDEDDERFAQWKAVGQAQTNVAVIKGQIRQNNARYMVAADEKLRAGDYQGFAQEWERIDMDPVTKAREKARKLSEGLTNQAIDELNSLRKPEEVEAFIAKIKEADYVTDEDGNIVEDEFGNPKVAKYKWGEYEGGGMGIGGRRLVVKSAENKLRDLYRGQMAEAGRMFRDLEKNLLTEDMIKEGVENGTVEPLVADGMLNDLRQRETAAERPRDAAGNKTVAGMVDGLLGLGRIQSFMRKWTAFDEVPRKNFRMAVMLATTSNIPQANRQKELKKIMQVMEDTLKDDMELMGDTYINDREVTPMEQSTRSKLHEYVKENLGVIKPETLGLILINGDESLRNMFDDNKELTIEEAWNKMYAQAIVPMAYEL